jgi:hypothetical protein
MTLQEFLDSVREEPYEWGKHDCAMFAAKATDATHGTKYAVRVKEFGATSARAYRALLRSGKTIESMTTSILGAPVETEIQEGDIVQIGKGRRAALGIASPPLAYAAGPVGFLPAPLKAVTRVWRAG